MRFCRAFFKRGLLRIIWTTFAGNSIFFAPPPPRCWGFQMFFSGASDRKKEKFLHFFPAKGKKCFQSYPNHLKMEKYIQKQSVRRVASRNLFTILANELPVYVWKRIADFVSRNYIGSGFFGNKISFLTFFCALNDCVLWFLLPSFYILFEKIARIAISPSPYTGEGAKKLLSLWRLTRAGNGRDSSHPGGDNRLSLKRWDPKMRKKICLGQLSSPRGSQP